MDPVNRERNGEIHRAGPEEVRVQGMDDSIVRSRALCGDERLREYLPAEYSAVGHPLAWTGEDVLAGAGSRVCEVQCCQKAGQRVAHAL